MIQHALQKRATIQFSRRVTFQRIDYFAKITLNGSLALFIRNYQNREDILAIGKPRPIPAIPESISD